MVVQITSKVSDHGMQHETVDEIRSGVALCGTERPASGSLRVFWNGCVAHSRLGRRTVNY